MKDTMDTHWGQPCYATLASSIIVAAAPVTVAPVAILQGHEGPGALKKYKKYKIMLDPQTPKTI